MLPFELTKDTPYLALSGELWNVFYQYFNRNWPCYKRFLLYSLSGKTSYHQTSWCLEAARLDVIMIVSLCNLTGISAALLPRCLSNFWAIGKVETWISWLRGFTRSCRKTSVCLVNRGPESLFYLLVSSHDRKQCRITYIRALCYSIRRWFITVTS